MPSCKFLPHGNYSLIPAVLSSMAWLASMFQDGCDYSRLSGPIVSELAQINPDVPWLEVGFAAYREPVLNTKSGQWEVVYTGSCLAYPEDGSVVPQDGWWQVAKAFDFFALVMGGAGAFFLWLSSCCVFSKATWRWAGYELLLASIFQALAFLWFHTYICQESDGNACDLFWGSKVDIVAAVFWGVAAASIFCYYPVPKDWNNGDGVWRRPGGGDDGSIMEEGTRRMSVGTSEQQQQRRRRRQQQQRGSRGEFSNPRVEILGGSNSFFPVHSAEPPTTASATDMFPCPSSPGDNDNRSVTTASSTISSSAFTDDTSSTSSTTIRTTTMASGENTGQDGAGTGAGTEDTTSSNLKDVELT